MNFIVGALMYHTDESNTFWLMTVLLEEFQLREIYQEGLSGMYRHCFIFNKILEKYLPWVHKHLEDHGIIVEMFLSDWILSFFCSYIPMDRLGEFFDNFFVFGWYAFH
jgi:ecotropic viral integration site 5 protein